MSGPSNRFKRGAVGCCRNVVGSKLLVVHYPVVGTLESTGCAVGERTVQWAGQKSGRKHSGVPWYTLVCFGLTLVCTGLLWGADGPWVGAHCFVLRPHWPRLIVQTTAQKSFLYFAFLMVYQIKRNTLLSDQSKSFI